MGRGGHRRGPVPLAVMAAVGGVLATGVASPPALADEVRDAQWHVDYLDLATAHQISRGAGVTVAVIDSGIDATHQDLRDNLAPGTDLVEPANRDGWTPEEHGTVVAGVLAGHGHGPGGADGVLGVAPAARILPIRTTDDSEDPQPRSRLLADGIEYAVANGATVISISLSSDPSDIDQRAIEAARRSDVVVVAAAGNRPDAEAVTFPAALPVVVAVGGVDRAGGLAEFSVTGPQIMLTAPGHEIVSTAPGDEYVIASGTSLAAPIVAGTAALVRAAHPQLTADEVIHRLVSTADDAGPLGADEQYGHGVVNVVAALTADVPPMPPEAAEPDEVRRSQWQLDALELVVAHEVSRGEGITVALVGAGVDGTHPDLHHNLLPGVDLVEPGNPDAWTPTASGTALAGIIAGHGNRLTDHEPGHRGVLGVAPAATVLPVRVAGPDLADRQAVELAATGIEYAVANGARVICYAGGIASQDVFDAAIEAATAADVLVVAAAAGAPAGQLWFPAANPAVVTAVALDQEGGLALAQPLPGRSPTPFGYDPAQVGPLLAAPGEALVSTAPAGGYAEQSPPAAPAAVLAGAAALVRAAYPELTAPEVIHRLVSTAGPDGELDIVAALTADVAPPTGRPTAGAPPGPGGGLPAPQQHLGVLAVIIGLVAVALVGSGIVLLRRRSAADTAPAEDTAPADLPPSDPPPRRSW
jgi:type VII secretion-associated serine protease mycosin